MSADGSHPRKIRVYKNGDDYYIGKRVLVNDRIYRNFEQFLTAITKQVSLPSGAVRRVFDMHGHTLRAMDEFVEGGFYVVSGGEAFKRVAYVVDQSGIPVRWGSAKSLVAARNTDTRGHRLVLDPTGGLLEENDRLHSFEPIFGPTSQAYKIGVFENGDFATPSMKLLLNHRNCRNFEQLLIYLAVNVRLKNGQVKKIYDAHTGKRIRSLTELAQGHNIVVASYEAYKKGDYQIENLATIIRPGTKREGTPGRIVKFYPNGDTFHTGINLTIMRKRFPTFEKLIDHINTLIELTTGKVRKIYELNGSKITSVEQLQNRQEYILVANDDPFIRARYNVMQLPALKSLALNGSTLHNEFMSAIRPLTQRLRRQPVEQHREMDYSRSRFTGTAAPNSSSYNGASPLGDRKSNHYSHHLINQTLLNAPHGDARNQRDADTFLDAHGEDNFREQQQQPIRTFQTESKRTNHELLQQRVSLTNKSSRLTEENEKLASTNPKSPPLTTKSSRLSEVNEKLANTNPKAPPLTTKSSRLSEVNEKQSSTNPKSPPHDQYKSALRKNDRPLSPDEPATKPKNVVISTAASVPAQNTYVSIQSRSQEKSRPQSPLEPKNQDSAAVGNQNEYAVEEHVVAPVANLKPVESRIQSSADLMDSSKRVGDVVKEASSMPNHQRYDQNYGSGDDELKMGSRDELKKSSKKLSRSAKEEKEKSLGNVDSSGDELKKSSKKLGGYSKEDKKTSSRNVDSFKSFKNIFGSAKEETKEILSEKPSSAKEETKEIPSKKPSSAKQEVRESATKKPSSAKQETKESSKKPGSAKQKSLAKIEALQEDPKRSSKKISDARPQTSESQKQRKTRTTAHSDADADPDPERDEFPVKTRAANAVGKGKSESSLIGGDVQSETVKKTKSQPALPKGKKEVQDVNF